MELLVSLMSQRSIAFNGWIVIQEVCGWGTIARETISMERLIRRVFRMYRFDSWVGSYVAVLNRWM